jgi:transposase
MPARRPPTTNSPNSSPPPGTALLALTGIGPCGAARLLVEVGDITRFPDKAHFASWNTTAPIDASSGDQVRHRLSPAGNRQINRVLHLMARVQIRNPSDGRDYHEPKKADGKAPMEAMRCVNRPLSDIVYQQILNDTMAPTTTGPGGHRGTSTNSSVTDSHPHAGSSEKSLPGPAAGKPTTPLRTAS